MEHTSSINKIYPHNAQGILLECVRPVQHPHVNQDLTALVPGMSLKFHPEPAVAFVRSMEISCGNRVCKSEKGGGISSIKLKALQIEILFISQHRLQPLATNITGTFPVNRITHLHIVGRNTFGNRPGCPSGLEKPPDNLLPGTNLRKSPVAPLIKIDVKGLIQRRMNFVYRHFTRFKSRKRAQYKKKSPRFPKWECPTRNFAHGSGTTLRLPMSYAFSFPLFNQPGFKGHHTRNRARLISLLPLRARVPRAILRELRSPCNRRDGEAIHLRHLTAKRQDRTRERDLS